MMTTKVVWVLLLVTAYNGEDFDFEPIGSYDTIASVILHRHKNSGTRCLNKEALCMRVEEIT